MYLVTPSQMREVEAAANQAGISFDTMMENAGRGLSECILKFAQAHHFQSIVFLCGNGNNAGDCFVAARILQSCLNVKIAMLCGNPKTDLSAEKFAQIRDIPILRDKKEIIRAVQAADFVADGVFGIGFHGQLPDEVREIFEFAKNMPCIAVDIPSGGNGETGEIADGTLPCTQTVTFGAGKIGAQLPPLSHFCGETICVDIGVDTSFFDKYGNLSALTLSEIAAILPKRPPDSHKGTFGRLLCVCGSRNMPGAAVMSATAALRCGVGTLCLASVPSTCDRLSSIAPEAMFLPLAMTEDGTISADAVPDLLAYAKKCSAVLIGCGLGQGENVQRLVHDLLISLDCPIILDADGLNALAANIEWLHEVHAPIVLTPHPAEMGRLIGISAKEVQNNRKIVVSDFQKRFPNATVVLKGAGTLTASTHGITLNPTGGSGLSKGGSGDVLAGIIASLTAQGVPSAQSAAVGAFLHGYAGDLAAKDLSVTSMLPTDVIRMLPSVFLRIENIASI